MYFTKVAFHLGADTAVLVVTKVIPIMHPGQVSSGQKDAGTILVKMAARHRQTSTVNAWTKDICGMLKAPENLKYNLLYLQPGTF